MSVPTAPVSIYCRDLKAAERAVLNLAQRGVASDRIDVITAPESMGEQYRLEYRSLLARGLASGGVIGTAGGFFLGAFGALVLGVSPAFPDGSTISPFVLAFAGAGVGSVAGLFLGGIAGSLLRSDYADAVRERITFDGVRVDISDANANELELVERVGQRIGAVAVQLPGAGVPEESLTRH